MRPRTYQRVLRLNNSALQAQIDLAERLASEEKWVHAAEVFAKVATHQNAQNNLSTNALIAFTRSAYCFEAACQYKDAAVAYNAAAGIGYRAKFDLQETAELYARAASSYTKSGQFSFAGTAFRTAATCFEKIRTRVISIEDAIPPLPMGASPSTMAGSCYDAASGVLLKIDDKLDDDGRFSAAGSSWLAGRAYFNDNPSRPSIGSCESLKDSLILSARFYKTVTPDKLRKALPLTEEEREEEFDPIAFIRGVIRSHYTGHAQLTAVLQPKIEAAGIGRVHVQTENEVEIDILRYTASLYQDLYFELRNAANRKEASEYYIKLKQCEKEIAWRQNSTATWIGLSVWNLTCSYGESMLRWLIVSLTFFLLFTGLYAYLDLITPVTSWIDYPYFSVITMTSLGYGDIHPKNNLGKVIACSEIVIGLILFGMFVTFASKRMVRD